MKIPRTVVVVRQRDPWILRDHVMVDGQDCLCIDAHPCHLKQTTRGRVYESLIKTTVYHRWKILLAVILL